MPRSCWKMLASGLAVLLATAALHGQEPSLRTIIDAEVQASWKREKVTPVASADDASFLRRIYLDLVGTIPSHDETKAFLQDSDPAKRTKLIDRLLDDPRYAVQQAAVWDLVLFGRNPPGGEATRLRPGFEKWLRDEVRQE